MKQKLIFPALLFSLLLALTACGEGSTAPSTIPETTSAAETTAATSTAVETTAAETTNVETEFPSSVPVETTAPDGTDRNLDARGSWEGDVYTNERFGFRISVPEGFLRFNDYQIAQYNYMSSENYLKTDTARLVQNNGTLLVMNMVDYKGSTAYLALMPAHHELDDYQDEEIFFSSYGQTIAQLESQGIAVSDYTGHMMQLDGGEKIVLRYVQQKNGVKRVCHQLLFRNDEDFMGVLSIVTMENVDPQSFLDRISLFDPGT